LRLCCHSVSVYMPFATAYACGLGAGLPSRMYQCIYVYMHACTYGHVTHVLKCVLAFLSVFVYACMATFMRACMYYMWTYIHMSVWHLCIYVFTYVTRYALLKCTCFLAGVHREFAKCTYGFWHVRVHKYKLICIQAPQAMRKGAVHKRGLLHPRRGVVLSQHPLFAGARWHEGFVKRRCCSPG
jgi:hypothetical protein